MRSAKDIEAEAWAWLVKRDAGLSEPRKTEFDAWFRHPRNRAAYLRVEAAWEKCNRLRLAVPPGSPVDPDVLRRVPRALRMGAWPPGCLGGADEDCGPGTGREDTDELPDGDRLTQPDRLTRLAAASAENGLAGMAAPPPARRGEADEHCALGTRREHTNEFPDRKRLTHADRLTGGAAPAAEKWLTGMTASHGGLGDRMVFRGTHIGSPASRSARENSPATTGWRFAQPRDAGFAALAASIVCVVVAVAAFVLSSPKFVVYQTPIGGREHVVLDDGGRITLNTNTRVRVRLTATERIAELERGEALFSVAHDPERPFEVTSRGVVARAVGTEFSVRAREDGLVETRVLEGAVAMSQPKRFLGVLYGRQAVRPLLHAGDRALIDDESARIERIGLKEIERGLLWRIGKIAFINETLAEAVAEFNRYTPRRLIIANPELAARRVGGQFETTDPDSFVQGLAETFGVRAVLTPEDEVRKGTDRLERVQ